VLGKRKTGNNLQTSQFGAAKKKGTIKQGTGILIVEEERPEEKSRRRHRVKGKG